MVALYPGGVRTGAAFWPRPAWWRLVQRDDIFAPVAVSIQVPSASQISGPATTLTIKGHGGTYEVTYDWKLMP